MKELVILAYTRQGGMTAHRIMQGFQNMGYSAEGYLFHSSKYSGLLSFENTKEMVRRCFETHKALIFVCATGIAVRQISPFLKSKKEDIPVLVADDMGQFVIALISGHLGGANELARLCADIINAVPVITTATDLHGKFAVDVFAKKNGLILTDMEKAKKLSAHVLDGGTITVFMKECTLKRTEPFFSEVILSEKWTEEDWDSDTAGLVISPYRHVLPEHILQLIPKQVTLGIGCKKGVSAKQIREAAEEVLGTYQIERQAVCRVCSIDLKKEEKGLLAFCDEWQVPLVTFSAEELMAAEGKFHASAFVSSVTGADNVCERSAVAGSGGRLLIPKCVKNQVTVAAAVETVLLTDL